MNFALLNRVALTFYFLFKKHILLDSDMCLCAYIAINKCLMMKTVSQRRVNMLYVYFQTVRLQKFMCINPWHFIETTARLAIKFQTFRIVYLRTVLYVHARACVTVCVCVYMHVFTMYMFASSSFSSLSTTSSTYYQSTKTALKLLHSTERKNF